VILETSVNIQCQNLSILANTEQDKQKLKLLCAILKENKLICSHSNDFDKVILPLLPTINNQKEMIKIHEKI
jgi:hypothetical protein